MPTRTMYDVVIASDLRFPGGTSASIAEEVRAQARLGYRTGLVQVASGALRGNPPCNPKIRRCVNEGLADLLLPPGPVHTRLLVLRHPSVFTEMPQSWPTVVADETLMVVNQAPVDDTSGEAAWRYDAVRDTLVELLGEGTRWVPIGPLVRQAVAEEAPRLALLPDDWTNVIDVDDWVLDRTVAAGARPVIGRHSRPSWKKWPSSKEELLAAYPDDGAIDVKILGGARAPEKVLGSLPSAWTVYPYNSIPTREFLRELDFFVYFHHPRLIEAFGRATLEALASGAVCIMGPHFRALFEDSCLYGTPGDVKGIVTTLWADRDAYLEQSRRGQDFVRSHFGVEAHQRRLEKLIGAPSAKPPERPPSPRVASGQRVIFSSSNGAGVGHLTRLMSMARRASAAVQPVFFTLSQAVPVVRQAGWPCEYFPSSGYSGFTKQDWNRVYQERLLHIIDTYRATAVVFDGTYIFHGLLNAALARPDIPFIWSRRGMWQEGRSSIPVIERGQAFTMTIEPGEVADARDRGLSSQFREGVLRVPPILYLDEAELLSREEACAALGLDPDRTTALVQLGAGNINDISSDLDLAVTELSRTPGLQVCVTNPVIAERHRASNEEVIAVSVHPLSKYLRAFDFAIAASGYNTYHELIAFGVPTLFVPNLATSLDDQRARAQYAEEAGVGLFMERLTPEPLREALAVLLDPARRAEMRDRADQLDRGNGAGQAMAAVERHLADRSTGNATAAVGMG